MLSKLENQYEFKFTLISSLLCNDYFTKISNEEAAEWKEIICGKQWIDHYESLPDDIVLEKCKEATIGLLPMERIKEMHDPDNYQKELKKNLK